MDDTAIFLSHKGVLVRGPTGKGVYDVTTLITCNAKVMVAAPLAIYMFKRLPQEYVKATPRNWRIGNTSDKKPIIL